MKLATVNRRRYLELPAADIERCSSVFRQDFANVLIA
jgi:hypothetical protein